VPKLGVEQGIFGAEYPYSPHDEGSV